MFDSGDHLLRVFRIGDGDACEGLVGSDPVNPLMVILVMLVPMLMLLVEVVMLRGWRGGLGSTHARGQ